MLNSTAKVFRLVAIAEAITWLALLIAMFFKWVLGYEEAVAVPGMVHGIVFMVYLAVTIYTAVKLRWNLTTSALGLVASIPPFGTLVFEWWAQRAGHLAELSTPSKAAAS
jgi:integral membrane protein